MKDIGLGILDPHTVVIVLVTLALAQALFGYIVPVDSSNAQGLFMSLVLYTGYLYAARSLFRLPLAAMQAAIIVNQVWSLRGDFKSGATGFGRVRSMLSGIFGLIRRLPLVLGLWLLSILDFSGQQTNITNASLVPRYILAVLDRLGLILIAVVTVLPGFQPYFRPVAVAGLAMMLFLFVLKGNFSALLVDALAKPLAAKPEGESGISNPESGALTAKQRAQRAQMLAQMERARASVQPSHIDTIGGDVDSESNTYG